MKNRIGPDIPSTHWLLWLKPAMRWLCKKKFGSFGRTSEFRPMAYAIETQNIFIGENVVVRPGTMLFADPWSGIYIEDNCLIGAGVHIYTNNHRYDLNTDIINQGYDYTAPVVLKKGCWVGANSVLLPGVTIEENSVVGAGSVVTHSVEPHTVVAGNPARFIKFTRKGIDVSR